MKKGQKIYIKEGGINFRKLPDISNDENIIRSFTAGEEAILIDEPWLKIRAGELEGWVRGDKITELPLENIIKEMINSTFKFVIGEANFANSFNTIEIRKIINDEFHNGENGITCLQCTEYAQFIVKQKLGINIDWPIKEGRDGKYWGDIFKNYYEVSDQPILNSIASFDSESLGIHGHVSFVEELLENDQIRVSEVNIPKNGIYGFRILPKAMWKDKYRGKFINFNKKYN